MEQEQIFIATRLANTFIGRGLVILTLSDVAILPVVLHEITVFYTQVLRDPQLPEQQWHFLVQE